MNMLYLISKYSDLDSDTFKWTLEHTVKASVSWAQLSETPVIETVGG